MFKALLVVCLTVGLLVACNSTLPPAPENLGTSQQALLDQGEACNANEQCTAPLGSGRQFGFCVDTVCCNNACGGGARDDFVCSNVYNPSRVGSVVLGPAGAGNPSPKVGECTQLNIGDPCGDILPGLNPCLWRGSTVNGGHNCPAPGNGTPDQACYTCAGSNANCPPGLPICVNNGCTSCTGNYNGSSNGTTCPDIDFPVCSNGGCVACTETQPGRCPALNKTCNPATNSCVGCDGDNGPPMTTFECTSTIPVCLNPGVNGLCVQCTSAKPERCVTLNQVCDTNTCVDCLLNTDCTTGTKPVCTNKTCTACTANNNNLPVGTPSPCPTGGALGAPACTGSGACVQCTPTANGAIPADSTACTGTTPFCSTDPGSFTCVECNAGPDCALVVGKPLCVSHQCAASCMLDSQCPLATPKCNATGACVECLDDGQCGGAKPPYCVGQKCVACKGPADCVGVNGGLTPVCSPSGPMANTCVACDGNNDSANTDKCQTGALPACKSSGACVECTTGVGGNELLCTGTKDVCNTTTDTCVECTPGNPSACLGSKPVCNVNLNNGTCVACNADNGVVGATAACPTTQDPACVPGNCFQCSATNDTVCRAAGNVCNTTSHLCVQCTSDLQCANSSLGICNLATNRCSAGCVSDSNCTTTPLTPKCKAAPAPSKCVQCLGNGDCGGATPTCDLSNNTCVACLTDAACSGTTPICLAGACVPCDGNLGSGSPQACKSATEPSCVMNGVDTGKCTQCTDTDLRLCNGTPTPACNATSHMCVQCSSNAQCSGNTPICNAAGTCIACNGDLGSGQSAACASALLPACLTAGAKAGSCAECTAPILSACTSAEPVCDVVANECVECITNAQCTGPNGVCNTTIHKCTLGCTSDANCSQAAPACKLPEQFCVECTAANTTKCVGDKSKCDLTVNLCVGCTKGSECPGDRPVCDPTTKTCTADCTLSSQCPGDAPVCDPATKRCVGCLTIADCKEPTPICNTTTHMCGTDCTKSSECPGSAPICNPTTKKCVDCVSNADCPPANPICNTTTNMCGTECSKSSECPGDAPICNPKTKNCVGCVDDTNCPAEHPLCDGTTLKCVSPEEVSIEGGGCACSTVPSGGSKTIPVLVGLGLALTALARRRRKTTRHVDN